MHTTYGEVFLSNAKKIHDKNIIYLVFNGSGYNSVSIRSLQRSTVLSNTKKYPLCVHVKVLCEMSKSSDPQILEGLPVFPLSPKGLHITVSTTYIEIHQF